MLLKLTLLADTGLWKDTIFTMDSCTKKLETHSKASLSQIHVSSVRAFLGRPMRNVNVLSISGYIIPYASFENEVSRHGNAQFFLLRIAYLFSLSTNVTFTHGPLSPMKVSEHSSVESQPQPLWRINLEYEGHMCDRTGVNPTLSLT